MAARDADGASPRPGMAEALPSVRASRVPTRPAAAAAGRARRGWGGEAERWMFDNVVIRVPLVRWPGCAACRTPTFALRTGPPHREDYGCWAIQRTAHLRSRHCH